MSELNNLQNILQEVYNKYTNNDYILTRIKAHITNLENVVENENKKNDERIIKQNELSLEQDNFCKIFLSKYQYYYMSNSSTFYKYDGKHYRIINEDEIYHNILTTLSEEPKLSQWKHKTKQIIIKQIKERYLLKSTPESYTIQSVLNNFSSIFESKVYIKYFLTIIGDCILKKGNDNKYFINQHLKKLVMLIDDISYIATGTKILNNFITKYHENHKLSDYRLIKPNSNFMVNDIIKDIINNYGIDILCVACYYSDRYTNGDKYIFNIYDDINVQNKILYFKNNSSEEYIFNHFIGEYIVQTNHHETTITWKNLHYLWFHFLNSNDLPNVIYSDRLKELLLKKYYIPITNEENLLKNDISNNNITNTNTNSNTNNIIFNGITSKYLPLISNFLKFWEKYIFTQKSCDLIKEQYEVEEIILLYKSVNKNVIINDKDIINIIKYYFSELETKIKIINNKYIIGIHSSLWNKPQDIKDFLNEYKIIVDISQDIISFGDLYNSYKAYFKAKSSVEAKNYYIVNKIYFESFIRSYLSEYILYETFVSIAWFTDT